MNSDVTDTFTLNSGSDECTSCDFFLRLFKNHVYYHFIFPKIHKRGVGIRVGGWKIFQKLISGGGRLFGTQEYFLSCSTKCHPIGYNSFQFLRAFRRI